jgi:hypothetical protein
MTSAIFVCLHCAWTDCIALEGEVRVREHRPGVVGFIAPCPRQGCDGPVVGRYERPIEEIQAIRSEKAEECVG